jgi:hypothetical protein
MHEIPASHENCGGSLKFWRKIPAENLGKNFMQKILAENSCGKFGRKIPEENLGASQNLGRYTEFMCLVKIQAYDRTMADVEISAPR